MADLEKNLERAIEEALQPDSKAQKGDSKPVKQGSSDAAKIESGKGEVVKPEENPVDKAVASIKSAEKGTKEVKGDAQQKGASAKEKQPKLKAVKEGEETDSGKASWDYWPGDHLWGQGRPGTFMKNSAGECVKGGLKISRSIPSVKWEGAAAACPKGWWVCTAAERTTESCGSGSLTVNGCFPNYTNYSGNIATPAIYLYKAGANHVNELTPSYIYTFNPDGSLYSGAYSANVIDAWVADAYDDPDKGITGQPVSINGNTKEGAICNVYPVWCCAK